MNSTRKAGVCLHVTSLPGEYGIGELGENAQRFILQLNAMGFGIWQVLPIGPTGYGDSPYQLQSSFAGNELLIDTNALYREGWINVTERKTLRDLPDDTVDFGRLLPLKKEILDAAATRFRETANADQKTALNEFIAEHDGSWLHDYALYRVLKKRFDEKSWIEWPDEFRLRDNASIAKVEAEESDEIANTKVLQFLFRKQWDELRQFASQHGVKLLGDMPFYIAFDSADAWANPWLLALDDDKQPLQVAGVPPDFFSADGQLWGNPIYDWSAMSAKGYAWWIERLRFALSLTDYVRIDHFRGFEAYWSVPADAETARCGEWITGPGHELFDAFRNELGELPIVAEDLGVITPAVDALRGAYGLPGMKVLQFELAEDDFSIDSIASDVYCYTGTHDNDTVQGWLDGSPDDERSADEIARTRDNVLKITGDEAESAHLSLFRLALESNAACAIAPMQDLLGLDSSGRMNKPGTTLGNWRWRFQSDMLNVERQEAIRDMLRATKRA